MLGLSGHATHPAFGLDDQVFHPGRSHVLSAIRPFHGEIGSEGLRRRREQSGRLFLRRTRRGADMLIHPHRDCQEFRVWPGMMSKKETHCAPKQGAGDPGRVT